MKRRVLFRLDQFVGLGALVQIFVLIALTALLIFLFASTRELLPDDAHEPLWWTITRFMDGGTFAADQGPKLRLLGLLVTATGVLLISLLTATIASKLGERLEDLRLGKSPVVTRDHLLILGFDGKVPLMCLELGRTQQRHRVVTLSTEEKARQEALLRSARTRKVRIECRTGDPRSELALQRVYASHARCIVVLAPQSLRDEEALRFTVATLLALRGACGPSFRGRVVVEIRRASQRSVTELVEEAGPLGQRPLPVELIAADDIVARVLAQSVRHGAVYYALRELLSFSGSELYLEACPPGLVGQRFEVVHSKVSGGIVAGVMFEGGGFDLSPPRESARPLEASDRLIVLATAPGSVAQGPGLPRAPALSAPAPDERALMPRLVSILGHNRTLARLIRELDLIMPEGTRLRLAMPARLDADDEEELAGSMTGLTQVKVERQAWSGGSRGPADLDEADGVVILGCEDEQDPYGDASALTLLLHLRHARRTRDLEIRRLITEVRDPASAQQIAGTMDDLLVSTDVVAMMLTQAAAAPELVPVYRELLDPTGAEVFVRARGAYLPEGPATFAELMAAARLKSEVAVGYFVQSGERTVKPHPRDPAFDRATSPIRLNPPREELVPEGAATRVLVIARESRP